VSLIDNLINKYFDNDIEVILDLDQVVFRCEDACERLAPIVYLAQDSSEYQVLAIGKVPESSEKFIRINLFDGKGLNSENFDKAVALESFFHFGLSKLNGRRDFFRPRVKLVFGDRISRIFGGYEKMVLMRIVGNAGAREVVFSPTPQVG